ncbi:MAG: hypothetical protein JKY98_04440, partial [Gammaproteobacteria bacterium]|nr:hypothetical protein [Gammaproteobacteria bacterium]
MSNKIASKPSQIDTKKKSSVREILLSLSAAVVLGWLVLGAQSNLSSAAESHFMGGNPHRGNGDNIRASRLVFPAGVRSNWHTHTIGQLLMVEKGRAVTQSR